MLGGRRESSGGYIGGCDEEMNVNFLSEIDCEISNETTNVIVGDCLNARATLRCGDMIHTNKLDRTQAS